MVTWQWPKTDFPLYPTLVSATSQQCHSENIQAFGGTFRSELQQVLSWYEAERDVRPVDKQKLGNG